MVLRQLWKRWTAQKKILWLKTKIRTTRKGHFWPYNLMQPLMSYRKGSINSDFFKLIVVEMIRSLCNLEFPYLQPDLVFVTRESVVVVVVEKFLKRPSSRWKRWKLCRRKCSCAAQKFELCNFATKIELKKVEQYFRKKTNMRNKKCKVEQGVDAV